MNRSKFTFRPISRKLDSFDDQVVRSSKSKKIKEKYKHINFWLAQEDDIYDMIIPILSTSKKKKLG